MSQVAETIREQIGGRAFYMMGAKHLLASADSLTWKIGRNAKSVTHVTVKLTPADTYTVTFARVTSSRYNHKTGDFRSGSTKTLSEVSDVYVDSLHTVIQDGTGLYLSL